MDFQRDSEVGPRLEEALHPKVHIALQSEDFHLDGVHQGVDQGTFRQPLVKGDDVDEGDGVHVGDGGRFETEFPHLLEKRGYPHPGSAEFNDANAIEQSRGEVRRHSGLTLLGQRACHRGVVLALLAKIICDPFDRLRDVLRAGLTGGRTVIVFSNLAFENGIEVAESGSSLSRLA